MTYFLMGTASTSANEVSAREARNSSRKSSAGALRRAISNLQEGIDCPVLSRASQAIRGPLLELHTALGAS